MKKELKEMMEKESYRMVTYGLIEENYLLGTNARRSYGIAVYADEENNGAGAAIMSVHDVTADRKGIEKLISTCNCLELSPLHLQDVIEDFLK